jgi:Gram-negative bacterial TonB protein C-terminal
MRSYLVATISLLLGIFNIHNIYGQSNEKEATKTESTERFPIYPGGVQAFQAFLDKNLIPPQNIKSGVVLIVQFVVQADGSIVDLKLKKGAHNDLNEELFRILKLMPKWIPGQSEGQKMPMMMRFPIEFKEYRLLVSPEYFDSQPSISIFIPNSRDTEYAHHALGKIPQSLDPLYLQVDEAPVFPGGESGPENYFNENVIYPSGANERWNHAALVIAFVVEKDGSISNIRLIQGFGSIYDNEAIRLLIKMPSWVPGKLKGEKVRVVQTIGLDFGR